MRFTIRDLLWLAVVVAFAVSWSIDRSRLAAEIERLNPYFPPNFGVPIPQIRFIPLEILAAPKELPSD